MVEPYSAKKAKKVLFFKLSMGLASFAVLVIPLFAQAGVLSIFTFLFEKSAASASAHNSNLNSQTIPLLQPAVNLDPSPPQGGGDIVVVDNVALVPADSPAGTPADVEEKPQSSQISVYTVREGDTLSDIAEMFDVSVNTIAWANDIKGRIIHPGQELIILPITGVRHTVGKGETLASIAKTYNGSLEEIANYNELMSDALLAVGDVITIPDGVIPAATPSKSSSSPGKTSPLQGAGGPSYIGYYAWPVQGGVVTQGLHGFNGIDIGANEGTSIFAAADGIVIIAKDNNAWNGGYGNYIVIQHQNGTQTLYGHAKTGSIEVSVGNSVAKGQTIAGIGHTGKATGNHLHFEVRGAKNPFAR